MVQSSSSPQRSSLGGLMSPFHAFSSPKVCGSKKQVLYCIPQPPPRLLPLLLPLPPISPPPSPFSPSSHCPPPIPTPLPRLRTLEWRVGKITVSITSSFPSAPHHCPFLSLLCGLMTSAHVVSNGDHFLYHPFENTLVLLTMVPLAASVLRYMTTSHHLLTLISVCY